LPLFHCEIELDLYVEADDEDEAESLAESHAGEELHRAAVWVNQVTTGSYIDADVLRSRPWGGDGSKTIAQLLASYAEAERNRPPTTDEIEAAGQQRLIG
jgi:hypothetical protein